MMEDSNCESFEPIKTLDLPQVSAHVVESETSDLITSESPNFTIEPVSPLIPASARQKLPRFTQVYSRRKTVLELIQAQESNPGSRNEITLISDPPLHIQFVETLDNLKDNLDLPIGVRKGIRKCTKQSLYPLSHYVSLKHLSPFHKRFIISLNVITISNIVSKALSKREWRDAMREEMSTLEKNKTWKIVDKAKEKTLLIVNEFSH